MNSSTTPVDPHTTDPDPSAKTRVNLPSALELLKSRRDKITYGGKYMDRYKDTFNQELTYRRDPDRINSYLMSRHHRFSEQPQHKEVKEAPVAVASGDDSDEPLTPKNSPSVERKAPSPANDTTFQFQTLSDRIEKLYGANTTPYHIDQKMRSPVSERTFRLSSPINDARRIVAGKNSNATHELNKSDNESQLIGYKTITSENNPRDKLSIHNKVRDAFDKSPNFMKKLKMKDDHVNIYTVNNDHHQRNLQSPTSPHPPEKRYTENTMDTLTQIEAYISQCEQEAKKTKNIEKFENILKAVKTRPTNHNNNNNKNKEEAMLEDDKEKSQVFDKKLEHLHEPLKSYNEVEDLLKPGVSDMQAENPVPFDRGNKARCSISEVESNYGKNKNKPLSRTASDAQQRPIERKIEKNKVSSNRYNRIQQVWIVLLN